MFTLDILEAPNLLCLKRRLNYVHMWEQRLGFSILCLPECSLDVSMYPEGSGMVSNLLTLSFLSVT